LDEHTCDELGRVVGSRIPEDRGAVSTCILHVLAFSYLLSDSYVMGAYLNKFDKYPACSDLSESLSGTKHLVNLYP
jgi:hypothetical protein